MCGSGSGACHMIIADSVNTQINSEQMCYWFDFYLHSCHFKLSSFSCWVAHILWPGRMEMICRELNPLSEISSLVFYSATQNPSHQLVYKIQFLLVPGRKGMARNCYCASSISVSSVHKGCSSAVQVRSCALLSVCVLLYVWRFKCAAVRCSRCVCYCTFGGSSAQLCVALGVCVTVRLAVQVRSCALLSVCVLLYVWRFKCAAVRCSRCVCYCTFGGSSAQLCVALGVCVTVRSAVIAYSTYTWTNIFFVFVF